MPRVRLAHFSDVHYTVSPFADPRHAFRGKRLASFFSYVFGGRRARFHHVAHRIESLLADVDAMRVDHAICTGDLTASSLDSEFEGLAKLFGARLAQPERYTVLPGNHDRYVASAVRSGAFERRFGALCGGPAATFPFVKTIAEGLRLVVLDVSRPTGFHESSGLCGPAQREALRALLAEDTQTSTLVALHYGLLRWRGEPDHRRHRLVDAEELLAVLDSSEARIALVLHGHMHGAFTVPSARRTILCAGSATDLLVDCGYFVYDLDLETHALSIERRHWNRLRGEFESLGCEGIETAVGGRRGAAMRYQMGMD